MAREPIKVVKCQHCNRKVVMRLPPEVSFADCPRCGRQTQARPKTPAEEAGAPRIINDPSLYA